MKLNIVIIGLSITSSWGNGHAVTYRSLVKEMHRRGHNILFLEHDAPWYAQNRDLAHPPYGETRIYTSTNELKEKYGAAIKAADVVIVGSYVNEGVEIGEWVVAIAGGVKVFYDIDTPVTLARLKNRDDLYINPGLVKRYDLYLSFTGGPILEKIEKEFGSPKARPLYCSVDTENYYPENGKKIWDLGYLGTFSDDRQPSLDYLMLDAARMWPEGKFVVAGPQYPQTIKWPLNVKRIDHISPAEHRPFYNSQRFTMNITRQDMIAAGFSPSVRLFEAAACATPVISDFWEGLDEFFVIGKEILVSNSSKDTYMYLKEITEEERKLIGNNALKKILSGHSAAHRAEELETYIVEMIK